MRWPMGGKVHTLSLKQRMLGYSWRRFHSSLRGTHIVTLRITQQTVVRCFIGTGSQNTTSSFSICGAQLLHTFNTQARLIRLLSRLVAICAASRSHAITAPLRSIVCGQRTLINILFLPLENLALALFST